MPAAIYYHPEAFSTTGPKLMGRNAAGESFLRAYLMHIELSEFWIQVENIQHGREFHQKCINFGRSEPVKVVDRNSISALSTPGVVFHPGPNLSEPAYHRSLSSGNHSWSVCGITHTTASKGAMDSISNFLIAPIQPWDALICTSNAVKANVECLLQAKVEYLKDRLGITKLTLPQLPIIPLGIHTAEFAFSKSDKDNARLELSINPGAIVVLFMGRLSFHAKAHPVAIYEALKNAAEITKKEVVLIECGWHANESIAKAFSDAALSICPKIKTKFLDGRNLKNRKIAWSCADIFTSLSDNFQETFGITPIEAMATGLPVVVSDWDGYRDSVRHGIDGYLVPTSMPQNGLGVDLALRHALNIDNYEMYCGHTSSFISVDISAATDAFVKLFTSSELRQKMGAQAKRRACEEFDWKSIINQYESLWDKLTTLRLKDSLEFKPYSYKWPERLDPFFAFAQYPTQGLTSETILTLVDANFEDAYSRFKELFKLPMINYAKAVLPSDSEIKKIIQSATLGPMKAVDLTKGFSESRRPFIFRGLSWLIKIGILIEYKKC